MTPMPISVERDRRRQSGGRLGFPRRRNRSPPPPRTMPRAPSAISQIVLSVGLPLTVLETLEANELLAFNP